MSIGQELIVPDCYDPSADAPLGFVCQGLYDDIVLRSTSAVVGCRRFDIGSIDKHPILASGMIAALDVFGFVEKGVEICFRGNGDLVWLDALADPPQPVQMNSFRNAAGMICGEIDRIGTVILVTSIEEMDTYAELTSCQVATTRTLRLRHEPGSSLVLGLVPYGLTLNANARTENWFNVSFVDSEGWISAVFVQTDGVCN